MRVWVALGMLVASVAYAEKPTIRGGMAAPQDLRLGVCSLTREGDDIVWRCAIQTGPSGPASHLVESTSKVRGQWLPLPEATRLLRMNLFTGHLLKEVLRQHSLCDLEKRLREDLQVVEVAL